MGESACRHINEHGLTCRLMKVKEIAAAIGKRRYDLKELHVWPEDFIVVQHDLFSVQLLCPVLLPASKLWVEVYGVSL